MRPARFATWTSGRHATAAGAAAWARGSALATLALRSGAALAVMGGAALAAASGARGASAVAATAQAPVTAQAAATAQAPVTAQAAATAQVPVAIFPAPGTPTASPTTQISIGGVQRSNLSGLTVLGSSSGAHAGRLVAQPGGTGTSFLPATPFTPGESVTVSFRNGAAGAAYSDRFSIAVPSTAKFTARRPGKPKRPGLVQSFRSTPKLRPPAVRLTGTPPPPSSRDIFVSPNNMLGQSGPMILAPNGRLIWFHPLSGSLQAFDFEQQSYEGRPVLTWWQGGVLAGFGYGQDEIYDSAYRQVAVVKAADGYQADLHDFKIVNGDDALITSYSPVKMNLTSIGGPANGTVLDGVVQEIDIKTGLMLFEWHSLGNVPLSASYSKPAKNGLFDYFHVNSVSLTRDGNVLISARNTWAIYKVNHVTGAIMWQLGGRGSSFKMGPGTHFAYQHDAREHPDGTISLFNNEGTPKVAPQSRGMELRLNMKTMRATLVHQWTHKPKSIFAGSQGNVQFLPGGKVFVGWGQVPVETEFAANGRVLFNITLASGTDATTSSYRGFRFPWSSTAPGRPAITTGAAPGGKTTVYVSWNGATSVARWQILAGSASDAMSPAGTRASSGFETAVTLPTRPTYVRAEALDASGRVLGSSRTIAASQ